MTEDLIDSLILSFPLIYENLVTVQQVCACRVKFFGICKNCTEGEEICVKTEDGEDKITGIKCEPDLLGSAWFDTKDNSLIATEKLVTGKSFLMCKNGECITVVTSGEEYCGELDDGEISSQSPNN